MVSLLVSQTNIFMIVNVERVVGELEDLSHFQEKSFDAVVSNLGTLSIE